MMGSGVRFDQEKREMNEWTNRFDQEKREMNEWMNEWKNEWENEWTTFDISWVRSRQLGERSNRENYRKLLRISVYGTISHSLICTKSHLQLESNQENYRVIGDLTKTRATQKGSEGPGRRPSKTHTTALQLEAYDNSRIYLPPTWQLKWSVTWRESRVELTVLERTNRDRGLNPSLTTSDHYHNTNPFGTPRGGPKGKLVMNEEKSRKKKKFKRGVRWIA